MFEWTQQQPQERAEIYTANGYEVRYYYEGGTGIKKWIATNPSSKVKDGFLTKQEAMEKCESGILSRAKLEESK